MLLAIASPLSGPSAARSEEIRLVGAPAALDGGAECANAQGFKYQWAVVDDLDPSNRVVLDAETNMANTRTLMCADALIPPSPALLADPLRAALPAA